MRDADRILALNDLLERRTPYAAGQQVTLDLAKDILALVDTLHIPTPGPVEGAQVQKVLQSLYKRRDLLESICVQLAPLILGPWEAKESKFLKKWVRNPCSGNTKVLLMRVDMTVDMEIDPESQVSWQVQSGAFLLEEGEAPTLEAAKDAVDSYLRGKGFILLPDV